MVYTHTEYMFKELRGGGGRKHLGLEGLIVGLRQLRARVTVHIREGKLQTRIDTSGYT